jgi:hypothetical protein
MSNPLQLGQPAEQVPTDLVKQLHEATESFHRSREHLEAVHDDFNAEMGTRETAIVQVSEADRHLDEIQNEIERAFHMPKATQTP